MKRLILMLVALIIVPTFFITGSAMAKTRQPQYGGNLIVATKGSPPHLDSDKTTVWTVSETMNHVYEGLFEFNANQKSTPFLAKSYRLINQDRTYAVTLRKGVLFHNGKEMTSADVKASFDRWVRNNGGGQIIGEHLEKAEVTGKYSISFTFKQPYAPFLNILASEVACQKFYVRTKEMVEKYGDEVLREHIGTGVYRFVKYVPDQYLKLERNDHYIPNPGKPSLFAGKRIAYFDTIIFKYVKDPMVRVAGIQTGEFHFAEEIPQDQFRMFENRPDIKIVDLENDMMGMLTLDLGKAPFNDLRVREALVAALDMEELGLVTIGNRRFWSIDGGGSMFPKNSIWYDPDAGKAVHNTRDVAKAKTLLAKSSYKNQPIVIVNVKDDFVQSQAALGIKSQLEKAGFVVDVQLYDKATVYQEIFSHPPKWDLHFSTWVEASPDPQVFGAWIGTNRWILNWDDTDSRRMDRIFDRMMVETDFDKRYQIVKEWNKEVWDKVAIVKTFNYSRVHLISTKLKGYPNYCKQIYWNTWLEK